MAQSREGSKELAPQPADELGDEELDGVAGGMQRSTALPKGWRPSGGTQATPSTPPVFETGNTLEGLKDKA